MSLTTQQLAIKNIEPLQGIIKVVAGAGTGKTFSLVEISTTRQLKGEKGLYLAFTKSSEIDAVSRFPKSVTCKTINAMAYAQVGRKYQHKLRNLRATDVMNALDLAGDWALCKIILDTIHCYCISDLKEFPQTAISLSSLSSVPPIRLSYAGQQAMILWEKMQDINDPTPMTHDGYLKLFEQSCPDFPFDYLMLDEAQDTNPVTWSIIKRQKIPVVIVGDQYQSIFQFRGAFNAMAKAKATQTLHLTESFRFGPAVADIANALLFHFFEEQTKQIGAGPSTKIGPISQSTSSFATICRTNAELFDRAVTAYKDGKTIGFVGGINSYGHDMILDAWRISAGMAKSVRNEFLRGFPTIAQLEQYAEDAEDGECKRLVKLVQKYGNELPDLIEKIQKSSMPDALSAQRIFSTAHKSKGLTLERVRLADDFPELLDDKGAILGFDQISPQEINLLYVAVTRASLQLEINETTKDFLTATGTTLTPHNPTTSAPQVQVQNSRPTFFSDLASATRRR